MASDPRIYPYMPSGRAGDAFTLCVEPDARFKLAFFRQDDSKDLVPVPFPRIAATHRVQEIGLSKGIPFFQSETSLVPETPDHDWQWPSLAIDTSSPDWPRDVYIAAIYEVDGSGRPTDAIGIALENGSGIVPIPPYSARMALFVLTPRFPAEANIAYILPVATYHAYNYTGGGCFYGGCPAVTTCNPVTLRRPGGGLGGVVREPIDPYDDTSPRQQFGHWDAKMISWIKSQKFPVDFYTDVDLDRDNPLLLSDGRTRYALLVSAGHHEYWTQKMYDHVQQFVEAGRTYAAGGGNYAIFSGNTCWWLSKFSDDWTRIGRTQEWPDHGESRLIGLSWENGSGWWGTPYPNPHDPKCHWIGTERPNVGYKVKDPESWVFNGLKLKQGVTIGNRPGDYLVGYECDGPPSTSDYHFQILAQSPKLEQRVGWDHDGWAAIVLHEYRNKDSHGSYWVGTVFNCGTTDWARVLTDNDPGHISSFVVLNVITLNVFRALSHRPDDLPERAAGEETGS
jgi:hypothetical protein